MLYPPLWVDKVHKFGRIFLAHLSWRLEWAILIALRPSSSVCKLFAFSTSSPEPLNGFWWNLVGMKYSWSKCCYFWPDPPRGGSRVGQKYVTGVTFFKKLLLQTGRLQQQTKCKAMIKKHVGRNVVNFGSIPKSNFWCLFDIFLDLAYIKDLNALRILMNFLYIYLGEKKRGCTNACICMGTHSQPLLQNRVMEVYETW